MNMIQTENKTKALILLSWSNLLDSSSGFQMNDRNVPFLPPFLVYASALLPQRLK